MMQDKNNNQLSSEEWRHLVAYRLSVANFSDSNDDGVGDLHGLIDKLDYIADLGVDAIQLAGFEGLDHCGCDGDPYFNQLQDGVRQRGLQLMADFPAKYVSQQKKVWSGVKSVRQLHKAVAGFGGASYAPLCPVGDSWSLNASYGKGDFRYEVITMLSLVFLTMSATPIIYQGQELGVATMGGLMPWSSDSADDNPAFTVEVQDNDDGSILNFYRQAIALRKSSLILQDGTMQLVDNGRKVLSYLRTYGDESLLVVANLSHKVIQPRIPLVGTLIVSNYQGRTDLRSNSRLSPYEVVVARL